MTKYCSTKMLSLAMLLMLFALAIPSQAQDDNGEASPSSGDELTMQPKGSAKPDPTFTKHDDGYYYINNAKDYVAFIYLVSTGNPYANAKLTDDIKVNSSIGKGDVQFHYRGTFDGQGHTIEMTNLSNNSDSIVGLFQYTEPGCVIKNLKVTGSIAASEKTKHIGSLIGSARGTKIENCLCTDTINYEGSGCVGGLVGISQGETFFENCGYKGRINAQQAKACYGFVGENVHMVSLKSNYVATIFNVSDKAKTGQFMEAKREKSQTILNNYACAEHNSYDLKPDDHIVYPSNGFADSIAIRGKNEVMVKSVTLDDLNNGKVCYNLNVRGRNGVVWHLDNNNTLSPFNEGNAKIGVNNDGTITTTDKGCEHHYYANNICKVCGDVNGSVEPLQKRGEVDKDGYVTIGYLRYRINKYKNLDTAELVRDQLEAEHDMRYEYTAAHIPETINVDGEVYRVDFINEYAFNESNIQYLYIGKNVNHIYYNVFNNCFSLKYVHIADAPETGIEKDRLNIQEDDDGNKPLFYACPLETIYIGRNLRWDPSQYSPFQNTLSLSNDRYYNKVFIGPLVTRVGNYYQSNPRDGHYFELFDDCTIWRYYFMGDDSCLTNKLLIGCSEGFEQSLVCYLNRTFDESRGVGILQMSDALGDSIFDNMIDITYGPYVKKIIKDSFSRTNAALAEPKIVDFTNAFNLEEIGNDAFNDCNRAFFKGTFENTKLKKIGDGAFYDCDNLRNIVIPETVTEIGEKAFNDIDGISLTLKYGTEPLKIGKEAFRTASSLTEENFASIYLARNLQYTDGCPFQTKKLGTLVIAPELTELPRGLFTKFTTLGALTFAHSDTPLQLKGGFEQIFYFEDGIASMFIDREIKDDNTDYCDSWGNTVRDNLKELTINVKDSRNVYSDFKALTTVMFGANVETVSGQFPRCTALKTIFAMGNIDIKESVFEGSTSLENIFLMGKELTVGKDAFKGAKSIKQVVVGLTKDPENNQGDSDAFEKDVYGNAKLSCAGDTQNKTIEFTKEPWQSFQIREKLNASYDFENGKPLNVGQFEHARIDHHFDNGKNELLYLPFDMDSYSFGADAEIYKSQSTYYSESEADNKYNKLNIYFVKLNLDEEKTLSRNSLYIVNTNHDIESLESHPNLFEESRIIVNNTKNVYTSYDNPMFIVTNEEDKTLGVDDNAYIYQDGVVKRVDNEVSTIPNGVTLYKNETTDDGKELVINFMDNKKNLLISSKTDLGFSEYLEGYSSFYDADYTYMAPDWCEVYVVTERKSDGSLTMQKIEDRIINKGQAVLIKSIDGVPDGLTEYLTHTTKETADPLYNENLLKGVSVATPANELSDEGFVYVLSCNSNHQNTGFYKLSGGRLMPAGKAYLDPDDLSPEQLAKTCLFVLNDITVTGVEHAAAGADANDNIYDVMGRSLKQAGFKGIYIINGKKVVVK